MAIPVRSAVGSLFATTTGMVTDFNCGIFQKFPVELIDRIVQEVLLSQSRAFSSIAALSVVSRQLRHIALKAYFSHLTLHRLTKLSLYSPSPRVYSWSFLSCRRHSSRSSSHRYRTLPRCS